MRVDDGISVVRGCQGDKPSLPVGSSVTSSVGSSVASSAETSETQDVTGRDRT